MPEVSGSIPTSSLIFWYYFSSYLLLYVDYFLKLLFSKYFVKLTKAWNLTGIEWLVLVFYLNLTTQILTFPSQTCLVSKLLRGIYLTGLTWKGQNLGRKVEVIYMDKPCNAC